MSASEAAAAGDGALFTRGDAVEAAWAVVDPVLLNHRPARPYRRYSWGPKLADALIATDGRWRNPTSDKVARSRTTQILRKRKGARASRSSE